MKLSLGVPSVMMRTGFPIPIDDPEGDSGDQCEDPYEESQVHVKDRVRCPEERKRRYQEDNRDRHETVPVHLFSIAISSDSSSDGLLLYIAASINMIKAMLTA